MRPEEIKHSLGREDIMVQTNPSWVLDFLGSMELNNGDMANFKHRITDVHEYSAWYIMNTIFHT